MSYSVSTGCFHRTKKTSVDVFGSRADGVLSVCFYDVALWRVTGAMRPLPTFYILTLSSFFLLSHKSLLKMSSSCLSLCIHRGFWGMDPLEDINPVTSNPDPCRAPSSAMAFIWTLLLLKGSPTRFTYQLKHQIIGIVTSAPS